MIILSGVLVVLAIALLVTGIVTGNTGHEIVGLDGLKLIYVSIGVSIVSALFLAVGVFLRRKELFGTAPSSAAKPAGGRTTARPIKAKARVGAGDEAPTIPATSAMATEVPAETTVYVVPGRKRYHLETCRQLAGRDKEELTFLEAREEGFTPCTACLPDTALAARAARTDSGPAARPDDSAGTPVEVTRTDIPAARPPAEPRPSADTRDDIRDTSGRTRELPAASAASPTAETAVPRVTPGSAAADETAANDRTAADETAAVEPLPGRRARQRSMFEPLDHSGAEPATGRTAFGDRDDETEPVPGGSPDETQAARDDAAAATSEPTRHADAGTVAGAASAGEADVPATAADETGTEAGHDDHETDPLGTASGATAGSAPARTGAETGERQDAGEQEETARPAGDADAATTAGRDGDAGDAAGGADRPDETASGPAPDAGDTAGDHPADAATDTDEVSAGDDTSALDEPATDEPEADEPEADEPEAAQADDTDDTAGAGAEDAVPGDHDAGADAGSEAAADGPTVRVLSGTKRYHRPGCALIEGIADDADDLESLSRSAAKDRGCTPCLVCQPDDD